MYQRKTVDEYIIESKGPTEGWEQCATFSKVRACTDELKAMRDKSPDQKFRWRHRMIPKEVPNA